MEIDWILVGEVTSTQGTRGEVRVWPHTEFPERFLTMEEVCLFREDSRQPQRRLPVEGCRFHKNFIVLKLAGIDTMNQALELKQLLIKIHRNDLVPLPSGRHYIFDLIGMDVITTEHVHLGKIVDVLQQSGVNDVYVIKPSSSITTHNQILIPVIEDVVLEVDEKQRKILVNLLDGLLE